MASVLFDMVGATVNPSLNQRRASWSLMRVVMLVVAGALLAGCGGDPPPYDGPRSSLSLPTEYPAISTDPAGRSAGFPRIGGRSAGSLLAASLFTTVDPRLRSAGATIYRIRYMSVSAVDGRPVPVTGVAAIPAGPAPAGGWPVVAYNHGNTGINHDCGPSEYDDMLNQSIPVAGLVGAGFAVIASDYEGLGNDYSSNSFLNGPAMGRNVIDGVRALHRLHPDLSSRWGAFGGSLGGLATWGTDEQEATYGRGDGLTLVGAAAWVPVVTGARLPFDAADLSLTPDQRHLYFLSVMAMKRTLHPDENLRDYLHGSFYANRELLTICNGPRVRDALAVLKSASPSDLQPVNRAAAQRMSQWLAAGSVPQNRPAAPLYVLYGTADQLVDTQWVESALRRSCGMGATVQWVKRVGEGHGNINASAALPWMRGMFQGRKPINMCGSRSG